MEKLIFQAEVRSKMSKLSAKINCEDVWFHSVISEKAYPPPTAF
jgi:hypothetical protein